MSCSKNGDCGDLLGDGGDHLGEGGDLLRDGGDLLCDGDGDGDGYGGKISENKLTRLEATLVWNYDRPTDLLTDRGKAKSY